MQEEVVNSVAEIDKTRKLYFDEEHLARQARDKEEKYDLKCYHDSFNSHSRFLLYRIKKTKKGLFSSFTSLQSKKERTSAHREASDIQSTQARNDYIMALAAGNAHFDHYFNQDLPALMHTIDDGVLDKCRSNVLAILQAEHDAVLSWNEVIKTCTELVQQTSADHTNNIFMREANSEPLR